MNRVKVKICGVTLPADAAAAVEAGADYIGVNLFRGPRRVAPGRALEILAEVELARGTRAVELVLLMAQEALARAAIDPTDEARACLQQIARRQVYGLLDASGTRADDDGAGLDHQHDWLPWEMAERGSLAQLAAALQHTGLQVAAAVLDTAVAGQLGGTGQTFDWAWIAAARAAGELERLPPLVLAGGLRPENVADAVRMVQPWAVDVSSGVEISGRPGVKDRVKMRDFIAAARGVGR